MMRHREVDFWSTIIDTYSGYLRLRQQRMNGGRGRGVPHVEVGLPGGGDLAGDDDVVGPRSLGLPAELHVHLVGQPIRLAMVAAIAGADGVTPRALAAPAKGEDVIDGEIAGGEGLAPSLLANADAAVGAGVVIPTQHGPPAPADTTPGDVDVVAQADHPGDVKTLGNPLNLQRILTGSFHPPSHEEGERPPPCDYGQRLVACIE